MKRTIDPLEHASDIMKAVENGVLITAKKDSRVNPMTVSWGGLAIEWGKPLFIAFVRKTRYTKEFLDATGEFTVNLAQGTFDKKITALCGSKSGRDIDKVKAAGLTLEEPLEINAPASASFPSRSNAAFSMHASRTSTPSTALRPSAGTPPTRRASETPTPPTMRRS